MQFCYQDIVRDRLIRPVRDLTLLPRRLALRNTTRIFAIGLSKTGTSSLASAFVTLGFSSSHFPIAMLELRRGRLWLNEAYAAAYQCISDTPVARFYPELDNRFPGSKFIITVRDIDSWLDSCANHFEKQSWGRKIDQLNTDLYGSVTFNRNLFAAAYERHIKGVKAYFMHRPGDLLVMDITKGDGWGKLCPFLDVPVPAAHFPWANKTRATDTQLK